MIVVCHLIVNQRGTVRVTKNKPALEVDEIAIRIDLDVPNAYFDRPYPLVTMKLPPPDPVDMGIIVDVTANAVADALKIDSDAVYTGLMDIVEGATPSDRT